VLAVSVTVIERRVALHFVIFGAFLLLAVNP